MPAFASVFGHLKIAAAATAKPSLLNYLALAPCPILSSTSSEMLRDKL